jgi:hypothetical protein
MPPKHQPNPSLLKRHQAAMAVLKQNPGLSVEERLDLLLAVVAPEDERLKQAA